MKTKIQDAFAFLGAIAAVSFITCFTVNASFMVNLGEFCRVFILYFCCGVIVRIIEGNNHA